MSKERNELPPLVVPSAVVYSQQYRRSNYETTTYLGIKKERKRQSIQDFLLFMFWFGSLATCRAYTTKMTPFIRSLGWEMRVERSVCCTLAIHSSTTKLFSTTQSTKMSSTTGIETAVSLKYTEFATPTNTERSPTIFLHGLLGNKRNFATIGRSLSAQLAHPRRLFGLDLRNHGKTFNDSNVCCSKYILLVVVSS